MEVNTYPSSSGRDMMSQQQNAANSWIYPEDPKERIASKMDLSKGRIAKEQHALDKENVAPSLVAEKLAGASKGSGSPTKGHKRQPLRDVTHMYCPGPAKGAVRKVSGLRSMR